MQRTRLSTLIDDLGDQFSLWLINPWRRVSLVLLSLLLGYFFAVSLAAIAGQAATQDTVVSAFLVLGVELASWLVYSRRWRDPALAKTLPKPVWLDCINSFKIGAVYALIVEAFKLGS
ncbi:MULTISPECIES: DUF565 domain-containing protein [Cyanophyceae]|uniref:DUF565 domain-containing protein n=1 Tax=Cyanophyceae TaxID=3028117 RepID=UPI00168700C3|nr:MULTISPECIES: DUF565 domain-containing protein [Cyanophyceae]MBD1919140.1 DUF565 domain-containing protein [Phormidium sp. FACHB-77]MBD2029004.1 DUF565 domain-containing protein [Phormidium sp. FACHB-322]MBD2054119.1 DUF565 domain-containing protein [Leptolyngbya sp. FACHB-60]